MKAQDQTTFFDKSHQIAIVGVSKNPKKFGYLVYDKLKTNGYNVVAVNPSAEAIDNEKCYNSIEALPDTVKKVLIVTPKHHTDALIKQVAQKGIKDVWIQQMSETSESINIAQSLGLNSITKRCVFMYAEPVKGIHAFHRGFLKFFGRL
ncbi:MAG: CoA-binding protein [Bacteroidetes bacterium]|nr:CoA-binding protein [Bacteroidota bacterium]